MSTSEVESLQADLIQLNQKFFDDHLATRKRIQRNERRVRNAFIAFVVVLLLTSLAVAYAAKLAADKAQEAVDRIQVERRERIITSCYDVNAATLRQRRAQYEIIKGIADAVAPPPRSLQLQLIVADALKKQKAHIDHALKLKDCSLSALGLPPLVGTEIPSTTTTGTTVATQRSSPKVQGAGTSSSAHQLQQRRRPLVTTTTRPGRRRRPPRS